MKRFGKLLVILLCLSILWGCGQQNPAPSVPEGTGQQSSTGTTGPLEIQQHGYIAANPDRAYEFPDERPVFSLDGGFYDCPILLELKTQQSAAVYYTTDGSEPDRTSTLYDPTEGIYVLCEEASDFPKPLVVKARAYYDNGVVSEVAVHTYFVAQGIRERFTTAVFAIYGDPAELTEGPDGIFYGDNCYKRGDDTEREVFIEAWDTEGNRMFSQYSGLRIYGGASRGNTIKSVKIYARKSYSSGIGKFHTDIFSTPIEDGSGNLVDEYDKLVLRNAGNDHQFGFIRDELCQVLAMQAGFTDYEAVVPAVVYLNGEYYGLFWLHESYCDDYFKNKYPNAEAQGEFVVVEGTERWKNEDEDGGKEQQAIAYNEMYNTYAYADLTNEETYQELLQHIDVENYLRYCAFNIYINNNDWPQNNYKCYRYVPEGEEALTGVYDGRWRYLLHDTDFSFHIYESWEVAADYDNIGKILDPDSNRYAPLLDALMHRSECREYFMNYLTELSEGVLSRSNVVDTLYDLHISRVNEQDYMYLHMENLRNAGDDSFWSHSGILSQNLDLIRNFAGRRDNFILDYAAQALEKYE